MQNQSSFKAEEENISSLLTSYTYEIKNYQRPYSWQKEQIEAMLDDVYSKFTSSKETYFMGSIVVAGSTSHFEVIDGQQRLTTFIILSKVIAVCFGGKVQQKKDNSANISKSQLEKFVLDEELQRVIMHQQNQYAFETEIVNKKDFNDIKTKEKTGYINAVKVIIEKLKSFKIKDEDFQNFINYLYNNVYLVLIQATSLGNAMELFKVINTRGLDLKDSDIIKATLLNKASSMEKHFQVSWKEIEQLAKNCNTEITTFFTLYQHYFVGGKPQTSLIKNFEKEILEHFNGDGWEALKDIRTFAENLPKFNETGKGANLLALGHVEWQYWKTILATAKKEGFKEYEDLTKLLCRFYYIHWILGSTGNTIQTPSFNLISDVGGGKKEKKNILTLAEIKEKLVGHLKEKYKENYMEQLKEELLESNVYGNKWLKPLLMFVEYSWKYPKNISFVSLDKNHIEHIIPRADKDNKREENYPKITDWKEFDEKYLNSIHNLTLLEDKLNFKASNLSNERKVAIYKGSEEGTTSFNLTEKVAEECITAGGVSVEILQNRKAVNDKYIVDYILSILKIE